MRACAPAPADHAWRFVRSAALSTDTRGLTSIGPSPGPGGLRQITIRIDRELSEAATAETLIHEVAHAYDSWTHHAWAGDHSATWGVWYSRVYCRYWGLA